MKRTARTTAALALTAGLLAAGATAANATPAPAQHPTATVAAADSTAPASLPNRKSIVVKGRTVTVPAGVKWNLKPGTTTWYIVSPDGSTWATVKPAGSTWAGTLN